VTVLARAFVFFVLALASTGCGSRSSLLERGTDPDAGPSVGLTDGFVKCGETPCDIASGNMCYVCDELSQPSCHTMDLPASCPDPSFVLCDGHDDCQAGESCVETCVTTGPCSVPSRLCR
jgi:hypothetical protein